MNDAIGEINSLEAAIDLLAAQERSKVGPIQERLDSCRQFIVLLQAEAVPPLQWFQSPLKSSGSAMH